VADRAGCGRLLARAGDLLAARMPTVAHRLVPSATPAVRGSMTRPSAGHCGTWLGRTPRRGYRRARPVLPGRGQDREPQNGSAPAAGTGLEPSSAASSLAAARGTGPVPVGAVRHDRVWTDDFLKGRCANGQGLQILTLVDEFTRECLGIEEGESLDPGVPSPYWRHLPSRGGQCGSAGSTRRGSLPRS
jgi:hypothetical protein